MVIAPRRSPGAARPAGRHAATDDAPEAEGATRTRLLDAAIEAVARFGMRRSTMADIAAGAGVSRQTVYRYFATKEAVFRALVLREEQRLIGQVRTAVASAADPRQAIEAGIATCLEWLREHPLLDPILKAEPEELLPYLTVEAHPLLALGSRASAEIFGERFPDAAPEAVRRVAEIWSRLMLSYALTPPPESPRDLAPALADTFFQTLGHAPIGKE